MLTMSTLMMPTTMTTMTNPGPIPAHSVPQQQKLEPPKMQAAPTIAHAANQNVNANKSGALRGRGAFIVYFPKCTRCLFYIPSEQW